MTEASGTATTGDPRDLSFQPVENPSPKVLSQEQIAHYNEHGYIKPCRIFDEAETRRNRAYFDWLMEQVRSYDDGRDQYAINGYHTRCRGIYELATDPRILELVEDLIGPNFVAWGTHFFCKLPHDPKAVPWHQDASYWQLTPARTVTVWLAIDDADRENAAMKFLPGTHRMGHLAWKQTEKEAVLNQEIPDAEKLGEPVYDELKAGEFSLHADMLAHGSDPNHSDRRRCGLTIRYCPVSVRRLGNIGKDAILCRGTDPDGHWRLIDPPEGEDLAPRK
jgi:hypothetical protein